MIDDLRALSEQQRQSQELLEQRVAERTQELEHALFEMRAIQQRYIEGEWTDYAADTVIGDENLPDAWLPVMETAVAQQEIVTHTNGENTLAVPVHYADEIIGIMGFGGDVEEDEWDETDLSAVEAIVEQVGLALENQRLFDQTQAALQESSTLYEASANMNAAETYEDILSVVRKFTLAGRAQSVSLNLFDRPWTKTQKPEFIEVLQYYTTRENAPTPPRFPLAHFPSADHTLKPDETTVWEDVNDPNLDIEDHTRQLFASNFEANAVIFAPMVVGGLWIGYINVMFKDKTTFSEPEIRRLASISGQAAVAVSNRQLLANTQERAAQLETLSRVEVALSQANSEEEILRSIMQGFDLSDATSIALNYLNYQPDGSVTLDMFSFMSNGRYLADDVVTRFRDVALEESPVTPLWKDSTNEITYIADVKSHNKTNEQLLEHAEKFSWQSSVILPLKRGGDVQAVIWITWKDPHEFTETEQFVLERLLEPVSAVVSSRRAQLAQQEALAETASLFRASAEMNAAQNYEDILSVVRKYTIAGQDSQSVSFTMFDRPWTKTDKPEMVEVLRYYTTRENMPIPTRFALDQFPSADTVLKPDEPTIIQDMSDPEFDIDENTRHLYTKIFGAKAVIFAPLVAGGQWIGYINVLYRDKTTFTESSIRRLASIAGQSAVAIQNIGLLEDTSRKAQREQLLREITAQVRSSADVDTIMKTAVQQIGRALGRKTFITLEHGDEVKPATSPLGKENGA